MKFFSIITLCLLVCVAFSHADLMDGLVLYMPLDEGSGSTTMDFSANGFEGEVMGNAKWVDGTVREGTPICGCCRSRCR